MRLNKRLIWNTITVVSIYQIFELPGARKTLKKAQSIWSQPNCIVNLNFPLFCHKSSNLSKMQFEFLLIVSKYSFAVSIFDPEALIINLIEKIFGPSVVSSYWRKLFKSKILLKIFILTKIDLYQGMKILLGNKVKALLLSTRHWWEFLGAVSFNLVWPAWQNVESGSQVI